MEGKEGIRFCHLATLISKCTTSLLLSSSPSGETDLTVLTPLLLVVVASEMESLLEVTLSL